jgi:PAS domain S-box-containing protein
MTPRATSANGKQRGTDHPVLPRSNDPFDLVRRGAIHAALEAIITVDADQRVVMINPAAQSLFGVSADEALGASLQRFIPLRLRTAHARHVRGFAQSGRVEMPMGERGSITGLRSNGEEVQLEASISRVDSMGPDGRQTHFTALLRDVSAEQALKADLVAYREQTRAMFERLPVPIWIAEDEHIVFANQSSLRLFAAATARDLVGRSIYELLRPESHAALRRRVAAALAGEAADSIHERIAALDGSVREVEIAVASLPEHGKAALQMVLTDLSLQANENAELDRSRRQLRRLAARLVQTREQERRHIARELHDELGQQLTALKMELSSLKPDVVARAWPARLAEMTHMVDATLASVRRIAKDLRPAMLDDLGLNTAIEWLASDSARRLGIQISLQLDDDLPPLHEDTATALYRMVQESLTNIARHAHASQVSISLQRRDGQLNLVVQDDGVGFATRTLPQEGNGLVGIRERAYMLGGDLEIGTAALGGGLLSIRVPLGDPPTPPTGGRWA